MLDGLSQQHNATASVRNLTSLTSNQSQRYEASGKIIRSILSNKDARQLQSYPVGIQPEKQTKEVNSERDKRPPRLPNSRIIQKDHVTSTATHLSVPCNDARKSQYDKASVNNLHGSASISDKSERRMKNKDRPDRGVWTARRSDGHLSKDTCLSSQQLSDSLGDVSQQTVGQKDRGDAIGFQSSNGVSNNISRAACDAPLSYGEIKPDLPNSNKNSESQTGRANVSSSENGEISAAFCIEKYLF